MNKTVKYEIFGIKIAAVSYDELLNSIEETIDNKQRRIISYVTANSLNIIYEDQNVKELFNRFDIIHPDGIGTSLAIRLLYGKKAGYTKITGSDFYPMLIKAAISNDWKMFFIGDRIGVLEKIAERKKELKVCGFHDGYDLNSENVVQNVNESNADILIVGMGCPLQERWILDVKEKLKVSVILAVGDGIKVFAGVKARGSVIMRKFG